VSLQTRLFAFFVAIVVIPLALVSLLGGGVIVRELERRAFLQLGPAQSAAITVYEERVESARDRVELVAGEPKFLELLQDGKHPELKDHILQRLQERAGGGSNPGRAEYLDFVVVADASQKVLVEALTKPEFLPDVSPPTAADIISADAPLERRLLVTRSPVQIPSSDGKVAWLVVGGFYVDNAFVRSFSEKTTVDATVLINERAVASTLKSASGKNASVSVDIERATKDPYFKSSIGGDEVYAVASGIAGDVPIEKGALVMSTPQAPVKALRSSITLSAIALLFFAAVGAGALGFLLARLISRPLRELALGADEIAAGNYDQHIKVRSKDEVGQLARAFNRMAHQIAVYIADLHESREELKRAFTRFGQTLRSTHDKNTLLENMLDASMDTLRATKGVIMLTSGRNMLSAQLTRNLDEEEFFVEVGEGLSGYVASTGNPTRVPDGEAAFTVDPREPKFRTALSVPLSSQERVIGVLNVYDKEDGSDFSEADMGTLISLADHGSVAIENVLLHQEAQQLAITDGLTGIWNHRYFQMQFEQEIGRSARFNKPFSLIVCDIDSFKKFNDTYGHQLGDSVLIELARRVNSVIRDIDMLARYGGEEFVLILPETATDGGVSTAEKIRQAVGSTPFSGQPLMDVEVDVTVSIGVACFPVHGRDRTSLLRAADKAMYVAKASGKNQVVLHRPDEAA